MQKLTQDLRQKKNNYLPEIGCGGNHSVFLDKLTLPIYTVSTKGSEPNTFFAINSKTVHKLSSNWHVGTCFPLELCNIGWAQKLELWSYQAEKKFDDIFRRFNQYVSVTDGWTDGPTDRQTPTDN